MQRVRICRGEHFQRAVQPLVVVPLPTGCGRELNVGECPVGAGVEHRGADALGLEQALHGLHERVVIRIADAADRGLDALQSQMLGVANRCVLSSRVAVTDQSTGRDRVPFTIALPLRDPQRSHHEIGAHARAGVPADNALGEHIHDERDIDQPGPGPHISEVGDPHTIWRCCAEITIQKVTGTSAIGPGGG